MAQWSGWELQKALFQALDGDATLSGLVTGVYDNPPEGTVFPYIVLGNQRLQDWSGVEAPGMQVRVDVHAFVRAQGHKLLAEILAQVQAVLHEAALSVDGQVLVLLRVLGSNLFTEADGITQHGVMQLEARTQPV